MNWNDLIIRFLMGDPDAIQAICAIITTIFAVPGAAALILSFNKQRKINEDQVKINKQQLELNRLALENDRRSIRPYFQVELNWTSKSSKEILLRLTNAVAYRFRGISQGNEVVELQLTESNIDVFPLSMVKELRVILKNLDDLPEIPLTTYLIMFDDEAGRAYKQYIYYNGESAWTDMPVLM